jgi:hypothetical protein
VLLLVLMGARYIVEVPGTWPLEKEAAAAKRGTRVHVLVQSAGAKTPRTAGNRHQDVKGRPPSWPLAAGLTFDGGALAHRAAWNGGWEEELHWLRVGAANRRDNLGAGCASSRSV